MNSLPKTSPCALVTVIRLDSAGSAFDFLLYGVSTSDLCVVPAGPWSDSKWGQWIEDGREGRGSVK